MTRRVGSCIGIAAGTASTSLAGAARPEDIHDGSSHEGSRPATDRAMEGSTSPSFTPKNWKAAVLDGRDPLDRGLAEIFQKGRLA